MSAISQHLVLSSENSLDGTHEGSTFAGKVTVHFFAEVGLEQVTATNSNTEGNYSFLSTTGCILENGVAGIEATALQEHPAQGGTGSFWSNQEHVNVFRRNDTGLLVKRNTETM